MPTDLEAPLAVYANERFESWPGFDVLQLLAKADDSLFPAPVTFIDVSVNLLCDKVSLHVFEQVALIAFERTEIVVATIDNQLTCFFGC